MQLVSLEPVLTYRTRSLASSLTRSLAGSLTYFAGKDADV